MKRCIAYIDGGSRGNPGIAGYGVAVQDEKGEPVASLSEIWEFGQITLPVCSDRRLAVRRRTDTTDCARIPVDGPPNQRNLQSQSPDLQPLFRQAKALISS
jgi:hypothetical protein